VLIVFVLLFAVVGGVSYLGWRQSVSGVTLQGEPPRMLGHKTAITLALEASRGNVTTVEVRLVQGGKVFVALKQDGARSRRVELPLTIDSAALGLREGTATLEIWARDDFWRPIRLTERAIASYPVTVDLTPPKVEVLGATRYVSPGGAGLVAFRVIGASRTTVSVGEREFPSFAYGPAEANARVALLGLPWDFKPGTPLSITARDDAGNTATRGIPVTLKARKFPTDTITVKDPFLQLKVPELLPQRDPAQPLIEGFLVVNRDLRRQAEKEKLRIGGTTGDKPLWRGPFAQPRNTKVFANFAEARTYLYEGRPVDHQIHFGYDLASTRQSPVPAANAGTVAFVGPLTIYGNTVIVDHGWGLQTLYAHLSRIDVKAGDAVTQGQELGRTGTTGLAIGDHLHFEVLVHGVSVTPLEWWDAKWLRDRIAGPLREAGLPVIRGPDRTTPPEPALPQRGTRTR